MAALFAPSTSTIIPSTTTSKIPPFLINPHSRISFSFNSLSLLSNPRTNQLKFHSLCCNAAPKNQSDPVKKRSAPPPNKRKKKKGFAGADDFQIGNDNDEYDYPRKNKGYGGVGIVDELDIQDDFQIVDSEFPPSKSKSTSRPSSSPKSKSTPRPSSNAKSKSTPKPKLNGKKSMASSSSQFRGRDRDSDWEDSDWDNDQPLVLPKPPAGFVLDGQGRVVLVSDKRLVTIVDPTNNAPLECVIRRVFKSSKGDECMLLCPVDMPIQLMKSSNFEGWAGVGDDELVGLLPTVAFTLAKIHMHFVPSGFCYTARGGFCYSEDAIFDINPDNGESVPGRTTEAVEITCFNMEGSHYMLYTPSDPLLFVAVKDENGQLKIAEDTEEGVTNVAGMGVYSATDVAYSNINDLMEDPAIARAIDEETEFNALVEEEEALMASALGEEIIS